MVIKQRLLKIFSETLFEKNAIKCDNKTTLTPNRPNPVCLYGLKKTQKAIAGSPKYRPNISQIHSPTCKIAR